MPVPPFLMFVCLHGSAKSVIASEYTRRLAAEHGLAVEVGSAGTEPDTEIPPGVVRGLLGDGIDVRGFRPRPVSRADLARASRIIAFGCNLDGLVPGPAVVERWDDVPAVSENYARARDAIAARVQTLIDEMGSAPRSRA